MTESAKLTETKLTETARITTGRDGSMRLTFAWEGPEDGVVMVPQYVPRFALDAMPWPLELVGSDPARRVDFYRRVAGRRVTGDV